jgi:hypothetical protein
VATTARAAHFGRAVTRSFYPRVRAACARLRQGNTTGSRATRDFELCGEGRILVESASVLAVGQCPPASSPFYIHAAAIARRIAGALNANPWPFPSVQLSLQVHHHR